VIAGLYGFLEVLVRLQKIDLALKICDYVLYCAPKNFHSQFKKKQEWFHSILYKNKTYSQPMKTTNELSEFGLILKEAMNKKK